MHKNERKNLVITHGTVTMTETARFIEPRLKNKTVVLTGAIAPYAFDPDEAVFNAGFAIAACQTLPLRRLYCNARENFSMEQRQENTRLGVFIFIR